MKFDEVAKIIMLISGLVGFILRVGLSTLQNEVGYFAHFGYLLVKIQLFIFS